MSKEKSQEEIEKELKKAQDKVKQIQSKLRNKVKKDKERQIKIIGNIFYNYCKKNNIANPEKEIEIMLNFILEQEDRGKFYTKFKNR